MFDHLRDTGEDVIVGVVMTSQIFTNFDKSWITILLGAIYIGYKIYTQHLKAKTEIAKEETEKAKEEKEQLQKEMINQQIQGWLDTKTKVEDNLKKQRDAQAKHKKSRPY